MRTSWGWTLPSFSSNVYSERFKNMGLNVKQTNRYNSEYNLIHQEIDVKLLVNTNVSRDILTQRLEPNLAPFLPTFALNFLPILATLYRPILETEIGPISHLFLIIKSWPIWHLFLGSNIAPFAKRNLLLENELV